MSEPMTELFIKDIEEGIAETGVKAAFLKCVVEERGLTPDRCASPRPSRPRTGTRGCRSPCTHTPFTRPDGSRWQLFREEGVDLSKVVVGHAGDSNDLAYLRWIADQGALVGCDRFGIDVYNPTEERIGHRRGPGRARVRGPDRTLARCGLLHGLLLGRADAGAGARTHCRTGTSRTSQNTCCRRCGGEVSPRTSSSGCSSTTRADTSGRPPDEYLDVVDCHR